MMREYIEKIIKLLLLIGLILTIGYYSEVKAETWIRSSSLSEVFSKTDNVQRIDYVDENGKITYAADKHYASIIKSSGDHMLLEEYFDENGEPVEQRLGYYSLLREYDELYRNFRVSFLDLSGNPIVTRNGYAILVRTFYEDGNVETEQYCDTSGNPINTGAYGYGSYKIYDGNNRTIEIQYTGSDGKPIITTQGYAILRRSYYDEGIEIGKIRDEFYYDHKGDAISLSKGQYGLHREYDNLGRDYLLTYLDKEGLPHKTVYGYTTVKRTYYEDDTVKTEMYFDEYDRPIKLEEGQFGVLYEDGKTINLDRDGNKLFSIKKILYNNELIVILSCIFVIFISTCISKRLNLLLFILYVLCIFYMTLLQRNAAASRFNFSLFWSYKSALSYAESRKEIINNILLFLPLGVILNKIYPMHIILIIPVVVSVLIETIQYFTGTGLCELDDIISNSIGGCVGFEIGYLFVKMKCSTLMHRLFRWLSGR